MCDLAREVFFRSPVIIICIFFETVLNISVNLANFQISGKAPHFNNELNG